MTSDGVAGSAGFAGGAEGVLDGGVQLALELEEVGEERRRSGAVALHEIAGVAPAVHRAEAGGEEGVPPPEPLQHALPTALLAQRGGPGEDRRVIRRLLLGIVAPQGERVGHHRAEHQPVPQVELAG